MTHMRTFLTDRSRGVGASLALGASGQTPAQQPEPQRQQSEVIVTIGGPPGLPPKYAVPDFIALTNDAETVAAAKTIGPGAVGRSELRARVLPDPARHLPDDSAGDLARQVPLDQWKQLGADGVIVGTVRKTPTAASPCRCG